MDDYECMTKFSNILQTNENEIGEDHVARTGQCTCTRVNSKQIVTKWDMLHPVIIHRQRQFVRIISLNCSIKYYCLIPTTSKTVGVVVHTV